MGARKTVRTKTDRRHLLRRSGLMEGLPENKVMKWKEYTVETAEVDSVLWHKGKISRKGASSSDMNGFPVSSLYLS